MAIQKLYTVGGNLATLYNGATALQYYDPDGYYILYNTTSESAAKSESGNYSSAFTARRPPFSSSTYYTDLRVIRDNAITARYMFANNISLTGLPDNCFNNVTDASYMFRNCEALEKLGDNCFAKVENVSDMFDNCKSLTSLGENTFSNAVYGANSLFDSSLKLVYIADNSFNKLTGAMSILGTLSAIPANSFNSITTAWHSYPNNALQIIKKDSFNSLQNYFSLDYYHALHTIESGCFSAITTAMITYCSALSSMQSKFENATLARFWGCSSLSSIPNGSFNKVTDAKVMFDRCSSLTSIPDDSLTGVLYADAMFRGCTNLQHIPSAAIDNAISISACFSGCSNMTGYVIPWIAAHHAQVTSYYHCFAGCTSLNDYTQANSMYPAWF